MLLINDICTYKYVYYDMCIYMYCNIPVLFCLICQQKEHCVRSLIYDMPLLFYQKKMYSVYSLIYEICIRIGI